MFLGKPFYSRQIICQFRYKFSVKKNQFFEEQFQLGNYMFLAIQSTCTLTKFMTT